MKEKIVLLFQALKALKDEIRYMRDEITSMKQEIGSARVGLQIALQKVRKLYIMETD